MVRLSGFLKCKNQSHQLLGSMGNGYKVMLALTSLLRKVSSESWVPDADVFGCMKQGVSQVSGASLLHVRIAIFELSRLVCRRRQPCIGKDFIRRIKVGEVPDLSQDHSTHLDSNAGDRGNGRIQFIHDFLDFRFNVIDFPVQFSDQANCMPQLQTLGRYLGTNGGSGCISSRISMAFSRP